MQHQHQKQQDHHQNDEECDDERDHKLLIEALSNAARVVENESFDPNDDKNGNDDDQQQDKQQHRYRYHPTGIDLRIELEKRWNDLIVATTTTAATKVISSSKFEADGATYNSSSSSSSFWFQKLYDQHNESGRYYHTMVHLWEMFQLLDILSSSISSSTTSSTIPASSSSSYYIPMAWATFFHDVVYDPKSNQNEKESAKLFHEFYNTYYCNEEEQEQRNNIRMRIMNDVTFENISTMIIATEKHEVIPVLPITQQQQQQQRLLSTTTEKPSGEEEEDDDDDDDEIEYILQMQRYFLDIDMTVLGKRQNAYLKYASLIRKEFAFVPRDVYCTKRAEILETFLGDGSSSSSSSSNKDKKYIYLTKTFQEAFEERARTNLREEINLLRKNIIPGEKE